MMNARILIIMLVLGIGWSYALCDEIELLSEDFEVYSLGVLPDPPWIRIIDNGDAEATVVADGYAGGQSCHFTDPGTWPHEILVIQSFSSAASMVTVEYYTKAGTTTDEGVAIVMKGDSGHDSCARFNDNGYIGIWGPLSNWMETEFISYSADQWYYFRKTLNCAADTETFYVEELTGSLGDPGNRNASYTQAGMDYTNTYIDMVQISTSGSHGADCYVDQLCITPEPATMVLLVVGGLALIRRKMK